MLINDEKNCMQKCNKVAATAPFGKTMHEWYFCTKGAHCGGTRAQS